MSKILCVPDIHERIFWKDVIKNNSDKVDKIVFLGDYLDRYQNEDKETLESSPIKVLEEIVKLKESNPSKYVLLIGNHDYHYIWDGALESSRMASFSWKTYHNFFNDNLNYFNLSFVDNNTIFTHAGITLAWAKHLSEIWNKEYEILDIAEKLQDTSLGELNVSILNYISHYRGGWFDCGSCVWADIREHIRKITNYEDCEGYEPEGDPNIFQVFGHTQLIRPLINELWACLDCRKGFIIDTETHEISECKV